MNQTNYSINQIPGVLREASVTVWKNGGLQWASELRGIANQIERAIANTPTPLADQRRQEAVRAEQAAHESYPKWVKACFARATPAPNTEEITIKAPESWAWVPTSEIQSLKDRIAELEADARIKAANANPGELVEFKGLNGETIVGRLVK